MSDTPDTEFEEAKAHVTNVRNFSYHLMVFVFVNALLLFFDLRRGGHFAYWVIFVWGIGLVGHGISVFFGDYRARKLAAQRAAKR